MKNRILDMLEASANADKAKALLTLEGFTENFSAIGDHTTGDLYSNLEEALTLLVDSEDRLEKIKELREGKYNI